MAYQYKVLEILKGELVRGDSLWTEGGSGFFSYDNTDSVVWVFGGPGNICYERYPESKILFATLYDAKPSAEKEGYPIGYATFLCTTDYLVLSEDNIVSDFILKNHEELSYTLEELRLIIAEGCSNLLSVTSDQDISESPAFYFYPNPTHRVVKIESPSFDLRECSIKVYGINGQRIWQRPASLKLGYVNLWHETDGVYIIAIQCEGMNYVKRVFK